MVATPTISAQSTIANVQDAINYVRVLVGNDFILREGQFAWANMYCSALREKVESLLPTSHSLHSDILGGNPSRLSRILNACGDRNRGDYDRVRTEIMSVAAPFHQAQPSDSGASWLWELLTRNLGTKSKNAHDKATGDFSKGHNFAAGSPEKKELCRESLHGFEACFDIYAWAAQSCATLAGTMVSYLYTNGWRDNQRLRQARPKPVDYFRNRDVADPDDGFVPSGGRTGYGQIIGFSERLKRNVENARVALNRGYLLTAHVISGIRKDDGPNEEEHSLTIIGQDSDGHRVVFAFWDPDAATSTGEFTERGFGLLYHADATACAQARFLQQHKNGRLTTARDESDLIVDGDGYHVRPSRGILHRYQAISLAYG